MYTGGVNGEMPVIDAVCGYRGAPFMNRPFRISIITPSFNQGAYIKETILSVLAQNYPCLEHIVVDGGSTDGTLEILACYPHLKVISEPDRGQADAINKGLRLAGGDIIGWLNSDDTYSPGVLADVASVINPDKGVMMAMGRCAYIDDAGNPTGSEHPSEFVSHRRVVEIWKGYTIPNPAVFFHRKVYEECGGLDESLYFALDYDLFCRYTSRYEITAVDRLWATYRLHSSAKTSEQLQAELLEKSLEVSRRYWGEKWSFSWWKYFGSFWFYGGQLGIASLKRLNFAQRCLQSGNYSAFAGNLLASALIFPPQVFRSIILPRVKRWHL